MTAHAPIVTGVETTSSAPPSASGQRARAFALAALTALTALVGSAGRAVYLAATDAWMAPITLSPDNDLVMQFNIKLNEQLVQRAKLSSDVARIEADLNGVAEAEQKLHAMEDQGKKTLHWTAFTAKEQTDAAGAKARSLETQRQLLLDLLARQQKLVASSQESLRSGLVSSVDHEREVQALKQIEVGLEQNSRELAEARSQGKVYGAASRAVRDGAPGGPLLPEVATSVDRDMRVELELIKLHGERRALVAERAIAADALRRMDDLLAQLKNRPIYRAVQAQTEIAFVPYNQLKGVRAGSTVYACTAVVFACHPVGTVKEVVAGEVIAQDPWSEVARGQYVVLDLVDHEAAQEKVLRARAAR